MTIAVLHIPLNAMAGQLETGWLLTLKPCITRLRSEYDTCACLTNTTSILPVQLFVHTPLCGMGASALLAMASEPQSTKAGSIDAAPGIRNLACLYGMLPSNKGPFQTVLLSYHSLL